MPASRRRERYRHRDSKTPAGPILAIDPAAFNTFVDWTSTTAE
ncbi:DUF397 domain-containing protein [Streptomyces canus]|nr:DUF397 domain-containing protein [Streptomyces canus]